MQPATTIPSYRQTVKTANIVAAAADLRTEILRSVPVAQRAGALSALAVLEHDLTRAIDGAPPTHTNTETR